MHAIMPHQRQEIAAVLQPSPSQEASHATCLWASAPEYPDRTAHNYLICLVFPQDVHAPLHTGLTIHFAQPDALKGSLLQTLKVRRLVWVSETNILVSTLRKEAIEKLLIVFIEYILPGYIVCVGTDQWMY